MTTQSLASLNGTALLGRPMWIFDMDGTLTVPQHDFDGFRAQHELPPGVDLLTSVQALAPARRRQVESAIRAWEEGLAEHATAQVDARALVQELVARGAVLAVLTRNRREVAFTTLEAAGLRGYFALDDLIIGREDATAKPDPAGVNLLLERAGVAASDAVMVGDWVHDVEAGARAGTATVLVERHGPFRPEWTSFIDVVVPSLWDVRSSSSRK